MIKIVTRSLLWCTCSVKTVLFVCIVSTVSVLEASDEPQYSIVGASFVYHLYPRGNLTQYFDNEFIGVKRTISSLRHIDAVTLGTLKNSSNNRCLLLGVNRDWRQLTANTQLVGMYAYVGDFFLDDFDECGDEGIYADFKSVVGIGFAPYIYHGVKYELNQDLNFNAGLILPGVISLSLGYDF